MGINRYSCQGIKNENALNSCQVLLNSIDSLQSSDSRDQRNDYRLKVKLCYASENLQIIIISLIRLFFYSNYLLISLNKTSTDISYKYGMILTRLYEDSY